VAVVGLLAVPGAAEPAVGEPLATEPFQGTIRNAVATENVVVEGDAPSGPLPVPAGADRVVLEARWSAPSPSAQTVQVGLCRTPCPDEVPDRRAAASRSETVRLESPISGDRLTWVAHLGDGAAREVAVRGEAVFYGVPATAGPAPGGASTAWSPDGDRGPGVAGVLVALGLGVAVAGRRWWWPPAVGLYHRIGRDDALDHDTRAAVFEAIGDEPGIHVRALARELDLAHDPLNHHLAILVDHDLVTEERVDGRRCLFRSGAVDPELHAAVARVSRVRGLLAVVAERGDPKPSEIAEAWGRARSTVSYHLDRLTGVEVLERRPDARGPGARIRLTPRGQRVLRLLASDPG
jgi:DNA-binding MarR family transcriptional regulator